MTRLSRHGLGALIGVIATLLIAFCLLYSAERVRMAIGAGVMPEMARENGGEIWSALAVMLVGAVTAGLVAGSRLSPLASLIPGTVIGLTGLLWAVAPSWMFSQTVTSMRIPEDFHLSYLNLVASGTFLVVGIALVAASAPPSRWRPARAAEPAPAPDVPEPREPGPDEDVIGP